MRGRGCCRSAPAPAGRRSLVSASTSLEHKSDPRWVDYEPIGLHTLVPLSPTAQAETRAGSAAAGVMNADPTSKTHITSANHHQPASASTQPRSANTDACVWRLCLRALCAGSTCCPIPHAATPRHPCCRLQELLHSPCRTAPARWHRLSSL